MRRIPTIILCLLFLIFLAPAAARAEGNLHVGQLKINPYVSVNENFSDNIYYTSTDTKNDSVTTTTPGIRLTLPFRMHQAELEYYSVFSRYQTYSGEDTTDYHVGGNVDLKLGSLFAFKLADRYDKGHEPRGSSSTGFIEQFHSNAALVSASYQVATLSKIQIDYAPASWRFKTSDFRDRDETAFSGYFYYRFLPKTSAFVEYDHKTVAYVKTIMDLDNTVDSGQVGLTWEMSARSKGTIKGGMIKKDFSSSSFGDFNGWAYSADVRHDFTDDTSIMLSGQRSVNESNLIGNRYFLTTGVFTELTHKFVRKLAGSVRGSYGEDRYSDVIPPDTAFRIDRTTLLGAGLKYTLKEWLDFGLDYNSRDRHSNFPSNDYREHSFSAALNISL